MGEFVCIEKEDNSFSDIKIPTFNEIIAHNINTEWAKQCCKIFTEFGKKAKRERSDVKEFVLFNVRTIGKYLTELALKQETVETISQPEEIRRHHQEIQSLLQEYIDELTSKIVAVIAEKSESEIKTIINEGTGADYGIGGEE